MDLKSLINPISNISGTASAGGGMITFLDEHAGALGVMFTALTFLVFVASKALESFLLYKEHKRKGGE